MTNYNLKPPQTLPSFSWQEAKEKGRRVLDAVRRRRAEISTRLLHKLQNRRLHADRDLL